MATETGTDTTPTPTIKRRGVVDRNRRKYSSLTLGDALMLIPVERFTFWNLAAEPLTPSATLLDHLRKLRGFDTRATEPGKELIIDSLLAEVIDHYPMLKIWKGATLRSESLTGIADYLVTPNRDYLDTPFLCVVEAKKDDFVQGTAQCVAEMVACHQNNAPKYGTIDCYGVVSNGQNWQFYKLVPNTAVFETKPYALDDRLPDILGLLKAIFAECSQLTPSNEE